MTNANMKLVVLSVVLDDKMEIPAAKLEVGEFIVTKVVELAKLKAELEGKAFFRQIIGRYVLTVILQIMTEKYEPAFSVYTLVYSLSDRDSRWMLDSLTLHQAMTWPTN